MNEIYAIEFDAPDIAPYKRGNTGVDYVTTFDSGQPGPHALIQAVTHGNETCGAHALDHLFRNEVRPKRGKLTLAFANVFAYQKFDPASPEDSRFVDEDYNRVWETEILDGPDRSIEVRRAKEMRPIIDSADVLLDIHSMGTFSTPLMLCHGLEKERRFAREVDYPEVVVCGSGHVKGRRMIEYAPFNDPGTTMTALLVECGQHWAMTAATVALDTSLHFLRAADVIETDIFDAHVTVKQPPPQRMLEVTDGRNAETDEFEWVQEFDGLEEFENAGTVVARDGGNDVTTPHDKCILIMPRRVPVKGERVLRFAREVT